MSINQTIEVLSNMGEEGMEWNKTGSRTKTDRVEGENEKDKEGHPKEVEEKLAEEMEWPCGVCGKNVTEDGIECVDCKKWCHVEECAEILTPSEHKLKPYTCPKCSGKGGKKQKRSRIVHR